MIEGFTTIVKQDLNLFYNYLTGNLPKNNERDHKVYLAALRVLGAAVMGHAILRGVSNLAWNPGIFTLGYSVAVYALGHDIFVMSKNESKPIDKLMNIGKAIVKNGKEIFKEGKDIAITKKMIVENIRNGITEGTFYKFLWNKTSLPQKILSFV